MSTREAGKQMYVNLDEEVYVDSELNAREVSVDDEKISNLAASIAQTGGLLQAIGIVPTTPERKTDHGKPYELSYGYSRVAALEKLHEENPEYGWKKEVPAMVHEVDESRRLLDQLIENLYRNDMNPLEVGLQFKRVLANDPEMNQRRLAQMIGYSDSQVSQYLRVTSLADEVQSLVLAGKLSFSSAREIAQLDLPKDQQILAAEAGANMTFADFVPKLKEMYNKDGAAGEGSVEGIAGEAGANGATADGKQKPATEGIRSKVIRDKYLPKFTELFESTKDKREKEEMKVRIDTVKFLLHEAGTEIGTKLAPWEEALVKEQKDKEEKEEKDRLRKKFVRQSVQMVNKIISQEPPPEADVRTKKNVQQALAEIQGTVKTMLDKGKEQNLAANTVPAGFVVENVDTLMQEIHQAWKDSEALKAKKKDENKKKREAEALKEKEEEAAKTAAEKGEPVTA